ncbi:MAG: metal-sulfur cluster assembly factor [Thermoleophilia bacterium]
MTPPAPPDRDAVMDVLRGVYDPCCADRGISIVDMGVVEDVRVDGGRVHVDLVLTTGWCPFVASMSDAIPAALRDLDGVEGVDVQVLFDPVWSPERLSPSAARALSMPLEELLPYRERRLAANGGA